MRRGRVGLLLVVVLSVGALASTLEARQAYATSCPNGLCLNGNIATQVEHRISLNLILWGGYWNQNTYAQATLDLMYSHLDGTAWQGILGQYNVFGNPTEAHFVVDTTNPLPGDVTQTALHNEVTYWANKWHVAPSLDEQFLVFNPPGQKSGFLGYGANCGAHTDQSGYIFSDTAYDPCGGITDATQALTMVSSHEYAESATDPYVATGPITGWTSAAGNKGEIGDLCNQYIGPTIDGFYAQQLWDNSVMSCQDYSQQGALPARIVASAISTHHGGYWNVGSDGSIFYYDGAAYYGSLHGVAISAPIVGIASTPDGLGYWLVGSDGAVYSFGDAAFHGSLYGIKLSGPVVGISGTSDGGGYTLWGSDGGVYALGDAAFRGSVYSYNNGSAQQWFGSPIVAGGLDPLGRGYWEAAANNVVCTFGTVGNQPAGHPWGWYGDWCWYQFSGGPSNISGMTPTTDGNGLFLAGSDGGVFSLGDAGFSGSAAYPASRPVVGIMDTGYNNSYGAIASDQTLYDFGSGNALAN